MCHFTRWSAAILVVAAVVVQATVADAQIRDAGAKTRGEYGYRANSGGSSMRGARDYSNYYRQYAQSAPAQPVDPEVARDAADTIGTYISKAQRHFAWMRTQAKAASDKEALASLDVIDKNLATAAKSHHEMHDTCLKADVDAAGSMKCCQQIDDALAAAIAEHDKLMKKLAVAKPATTK